MYPKRGILVIKQEFGKKLADYIYLPFIILRYNINKYF